MHRTFWDRLFLRYHPLGMFADSTIEIGASRATVIMMDNSPAHEFFDDMNLILERVGDKLLVSGVAFWIKQEKQSLRQLRVYGMWPTMRVSTLITATMLLK